MAIIYKNSQFESYSKQIRIEKATNHTQDIYQVVLSLLDISFRNEPIRLIGVRVSDLSSDRTEQISLFDLDHVEDNANDDLQKIVDAINNRFGNETLIPASMKKKVDLQNKR